MLKKCLPLVLTFVFLGCIGEDLIDDYVAPTLRITNPILSISEGGSYQFIAKYFDTAGEEVLQPRLQWSTETANTISVNALGTIEALTPGQGVVVVATQSRLGEDIKKKLAFEITALLIENQETSNTTSNTTVSSTTEETTNAATNTSTLDNTSTTTVTQGTSSDTTTDGNSTTTTETVIVVAPQFFEGQVNTTSSYILQGNYRYGYVDGVLKLQLDDTYKADTTLPGLYVYLGNNPNTVSGAYEIGKVTVFEGEHSYTLPSSFGLMDYKYILYWCKPFNVKVGDTQLFD